MKVTLELAGTVLPGFTAIETAGTSNVGAVVPVVTPPIPVQLEVVPVSVKFTNVPWLLLPLKSDNAVTPALLAFSTP